MKIGLLGAGTVAQAFARHAIASGHEVVFSNSRGPDTLKSLVQEFGEKASAGTMKEVVELELVLLAVPWKHVQSVLQSLGEWKNQILIDPTNPIDENGVVNLSGENTSQLIASYAPGARLVKAMNANFMENFEQDPRQGQFRRVIFVSGDYKGAVEVVADLFESFGLAPILLGSLESGGRMQQVGNTLAGHDFFIPWPAPRSFPQFNGEQ